MNRRIRSDCMEMRGTLNDQGLPEWFRKMMSGRNTSAFSMIPFRTPSMMNSLTMNDQNNLITPFMRSERGMETTLSNHKCNYHEINEESMSRYKSINHQYSHGYFPFYHFGNWGGNMSGVIRIQSAFPMRDLNGDYFNMGASFGNGNNYHFLKYPSSLDMNNYQVVGTVPSRYPNHIGCFHAYGITDNYFVLCEQPIGFNASQFTNSQIVSGDYNMEFLQRECNYFYIMDKRSGKCREVRYVTDNPYFIYNFVNCYEYENQIVIDAMGLNGSDLYSSINPDSPISSRFFRERYNSSKIMRFRLPLGSNSSSQMDWNNSTSWKQDSNKMILQPQYPFSESECMYPCINPNYNCRKNQYTYGQSGNSMIKFDAKNGRNLTWRGDNELRRPFRSVFVPNPSGMYEDDGVVVSWCSHSRDDFSKQYMVFINAHNMEEISRLNCDSPLPFGSSNSFNSSYFM
ncbi:beta,beta-carotene 15,15'-dioxygenase-like [Lepeophtheirus salmonis]|uniref:beta,beta-carotene 15,15'-dioxygenase-like n=1 Tax=Lepeophtheirus salmonis TaxID=72036 RepID=UPI001AE3B5B9|nr:beta,beta-carotene 15,15'-dioxygenase-like [Lepeophtheirus salmonis]